MCFGEDVEGDVVEVMNFHFLCSMLIENKMNISGEE